MNLTGLRAYIPGGSWFCYDPELHPTFRTTSRLRALWHEWRWHR